ncbi:RhoGAP-domain-containing protein [Aulographum hederae CBS 113979]|uniref:RhoGAP-domain-containing protein n=1 Tax=Aulographum hederae CBS 113979 TaxID=1176131 RepID=A0A6G1H415_9PEZI|nr:RhoGAP-domain-containing protein [Aulographum hederae CBS 113979]
MILGLNRDLERALKDKERYRRKLKEQFPRLESSASMRTDSAMDRENSQSPAPGERLQESSRASGSGTQKASKKSLALALQQNQMRSLSESPTPPAQLAPLPESPIQPSDSISAKGSVGDPASTHVSPIDARPPVQAVQGVKPSFAPISPTGNAVVSVNETEPEGMISPRTQLSPDLHPAPLSFRAAQKAPAVSVTEPTPQMDSGKFQSPIEKAAPPFRKAPPAPLNLSNEPRTSAHLYQSRKEEDSESEYDDTLEDVEIPVFERGRRKTREDDDRLREAIALQEERSRSKRQSKSKSKHGSKVTSAASSKQTSPNQEMIAAAPLAVGLVPGLPASPRMAQAPASINALLSPANSEGSTGNRSLTTPLMSPGLPTSPRPGDRPMNSPLPRMPMQSIASPPLSPRPGHNVMPLSPRAPRQPIPLPLASPLAVTSPHLARAENYTVHQQSAEVAEAVQGASLDRVLNAPPPPPTAAPPAVPTTPLDEPSSPEQIYRGLESESYPGLLLPPNALPSIHVQVFSSRLTPSRASVLMSKPFDEDPVFTLGIYARSNRKQLWRLEKTMNALPALHQQVMMLCNSFTGRLPEKNLFMSHAPAKIDARRAALDEYFDLLLDTPMDERAARVVCQFFSTDVIGALIDNAQPVPKHVDSPAVSVSPKVRQTKEGYLTKRGKNFGGWKARYFTLESSEFKYFEAQGGPQMGTIKLTNAQIGRQQSPKQSDQSPSRGDEDDNQYRHAFIILEPKKRDSSAVVKHVLCAESDEERDAWVAALLQYVDPSDNKAKENSASAKEGAPPSPSLNKGSPDRSLERRKQLKEREVRPPADPIRTISYDSTLPGQPPSTRDRDLQSINYQDTVAGSTPSRDQQPFQRAVNNAFSNEKAPHEPTVRGAEAKMNTSLPSPPLNSNFSISKPSNGAVIQDAGSWGNKPATSVKDKKRSIFAGFRGRSSSDTVPLANPRIQAVFGATLMEAVEYTRVRGSDSLLPAIVYRCLEYLKAHGAVAEEGIFRLNGATNTVKALRERFNTEGDVQLMDIDFLDINAAASLLKAYLRELAGPVLGSRELYMEFLEVLKRDAKQDRVAGCNYLVNQMPPAHRELMQSLMAFLVDIINHSEVNRMNLRNICIIFAPTLNIPSPLVALFLSDFEAIFAAPAVDEANSPIREVTINAPAPSSTDLRSPRHQMFSDLPTPSYGQTTFSSIGGFQPMAPNNNNFAYFAAPGSSRQQQYAGENGNGLGFASMNSNQQPTANDYAAGNGGYSSLNGSLAPPSTQAQQAAATRRSRRESHVMQYGNMGFGTRAGSSHTVRSQRDDSRGSRERAMDRV